MRKWYSEETVKKIINFKEELFKLYDKYDLAISHEDGHGAFEITTLEDFYKEWMTEGLDSQIEEIEKKLDIEREVKKLEGEL